MAVFSSSARSSASLDAAPSSDERDSGLDSESATTTSRAKTKKAALETTETPAWMACGGRRQSVCWGLFFIFYFWFLFWFSKRFFFSGEAGGRGGT